MWANRDSWRDYKNKIIEVRYEGFSPWIFFPRPGDSNNYYGLHAFVALRSLGYGVQRNLNPGPRLLTLLEHSPYYFDMAIGKGFAAGLKDYAQKKIKDKSDIKPFLKKSSLDTELITGITRSIDRFW